MNKINFIMRDDFTLKYLDRGNGVSTIIVIGSHLYYPRTFSSRLEKNFRMIYLDHRAFSVKKGKSLKSDFILEKLLDDIEAIRQELKLKKVSVMGHSIHALIAIEYAKKFHVTVDKLILVASSPISGTRLYKEANRYFEESVCPKRKLMLSENIEKFKERTEDEQRFATRMLKLGPMIWYNYDFDSKHLWDGVALDPIGASMVWGDIFTNYKVKDVDNIKLPVFIALGRYDYWNPPHLWEEYRSLFFNLTLRVFEKSGHTPQLEEQEYFDKELITWFKSYD